MARAARKSGKGTSSAAGSARHRVLLVLFAFVPLVVAFLFYLQTADGFRRVVLPAINHFTGLTLQVGEGHLTFLGELDAAHVRLHLPDAGVDVRIDHLAASLAWPSPWSETPHISNATIRGVQVALEPPTSPQQPGPAAAGAVLPATLTIPLRIDALTLEDATVTRTTGSEVEAVIGPFTLHAEHIEPGTLATASLDGRFVFLPHTPQDTWNGRTKSTLTLTQDNDGRVRQVTLNSSTHAEAPGQASIQPLDVTTKLTAKFPPRSNIAVTFALAAAHPHMPVGHLNGSLQWQPNVASDHPLDALRSATIDVQDADATALNPLLALLKFHMLHSGHIAGHIAFAARAGGPRHIGATLDLRDVSATIDRSSRNTPPLSLHLSQTGTWDARAGTVALKDANLRVALSGRPVLVSQLDRPLSLDLSGAPAAANAQPANVAHLTTTIDGLAAADMKPWLACFHNHTLESLADGVLNGKLSVAAAADGRQATVSGTLRAQKLRLVTPENAQPIGPLDVSGDLDATVTAPDQIALRHLRAELSAAGRPALTTTLSGTYAWRQQSGQAAVQLVAEDLSRVLTLGQLLSAQARRDLRAGRLTGTVTLARKSPQAPLTVNGQANLQNLTLTAVAPRPITRGLRLTAAAQIPPPWNRVEISRFALDTRRANGTHVGSFSGNGSLALRGPATSQMIVKTRTLELAPVLEIFGISEGKHFGLLPLDAEVRVDSDPTSPGFTLNGTQHVTLNPQAPGLRPQPIVVSLAETMHHPGGKETSFTGDLSAARHGQPNDEVHMDGTWGNVGIRPTLRLNADIKRWDLTPYLLPLLQPAGETKHAAPAAEPKQPSVTTQPAAPMDLNLDLKIHACRFREITIASGAATVVRSGPDLRVDVSPTRLLGGSLQGTMQQHSSKGDHALSWNARVQHVDVGRLTRSFGMTGNERVEGILDLTTAAKGNGATAEALRQQLKGEITADMSKARIAGLGVLRFMARTTGIPQFEDLAFDTWVAKATLADGQAHIDQMEAKGLVANLVITGSASLTGVLDLNINPRLGPSLSPQLTSIFGVGYLVKTAAGFLSLPIDFTVSGPYSSPTFGVTPRAPGVLNKLPSAARSVFGTGAKVGSEILNGTTGFLKRLFGAGDDK